MTTQELIEYAIADKQLPQYLYKYRNNCANTDQIFTNAELWFGSPTTFNDPFDCQININTENTYEQIKTWFQNNAPHLGTEYIKERSTQLTENPEEWSAALKTIFKKVFVNTGICCFGQTDDNLLLWSHYTDSHSGFCLKFDVLKEKEVFSNLLRTVYKKEYPFYNHLTTPLQFTEMLIRTKADIWEYEQEFRVIKPNRVGTHKFSKSALVGVTFGCRCPTQEVCRIMELAINSGFSHLEFKQAVVSKSSFQVDIISL
ncbi:MAG: DUF2971 domain-containing protein [Opitutaceae bacterium]|nr:DUF2971 domain-containing protein [Cytophagales bacterium]